ncbi:MAG: hypothetical protein RR230_03015 [Oscillospiraceae bacterium]
MKKIFDKLFIILGALFILCVLVGVLLKSAVGVSFYENRALAPLPVLNAESALDGGFSTDLQAYLTDRAPGRTLAIKAGTFFKLNVLRRPVVNGVAVTDDVLLQYNPYTTFGTDYIADAAAEVGGDLADLRDFIEELGGSFYYLGVPEQYSYFSARYPYYLDNRAWCLDIIHRDFSAALAKNDIEFIDMAEEYEKLGNPADFYFASDHHYNFPGAFAAYTALIERINSDRALPLPLLGEDDLSLTALPNPFLGSRNRELYGLRPMGDSLIIAEPKAALPFSRWDNGVSSEPRTNHVPYWSGDAVSYSVYMGGDFGETVIKTERPELPRALIFGDSFTNAIETLLYASFDETRSLDLRYYDAMTLREYLLDYRPDVVICVRDDTVYLYKTGNGNIA